MRQGGNITGPGGNGGGGGYGFGCAGGGGGTILFVGDLHWRTTDASLTQSSAKCGPLKKLKFFNEIEKANGNSKGYSLVVHNHHFLGMLSSFPPVGNVGLAGVAPHVNPAFFG